MKLDRQAREALGLQTPPYGYDLRTYAVDQFGAGRDMYLQVMRSYSQPGMTAMAWHECVQIGPRGGCRTIYRNFY
jgi:hypothetical protein